MQYEYCRRWNFRRIAPIDPLTEEQARGIDEQGELYTVVVGNPEKPDSVIEVAWKNDHLGVFFLDATGRAELHYSFRRNESDRLFLGKITRWGYREQTARTINESAAIEVLQYKPDGTVHREVRDKEAGEKMSYDYRDVSVEINWESLPQFGAWEAVADRNRGVEQLDSSDS